jgi:hypothetical protein
MRKIPRTAAWAVLATTLSACGPTVDLSIRVRSEPANVLYGAPPPADVAPLGPRPVAPDTGTNAPGFIAPPVFTGDLPQVPGSVGGPDAPAGGDAQKPPAQAAPPVLPPLPCPKAPADAVPDEAAPTTVRGAPAAGTYTYRRDATFKKAAKGAKSPQNADALTLGLAAPIKLPTELQRTVQNVQTVPGGDAGDQTTYDVVSQEAGVRSVTQWLVVSPPADSDTETGGSGPSGPGMYIRGIETTVTQKDGTATLDVFRPTPPVKVVDLPFVPQQFDTTPAASRGIDPITGANMDVFPATEKQVDVDVCGKLFRAWRVRLGQEAPSTAGPNRVVNEYNHPFRHSWKFVGTIDVLPQLGGIVAQDSLHFFDGVDDQAKAFDLQTDATLSSVTPRTAPGTAP